MSLTVYKLSRFTFVQIDSAISTTAPPPNYGLRPFIAKLWPTLLEMLVNVVTLKFNKEIKNAVMYRVFRLKPGLYSVVSLL